jgi:hypothetical protein
VLLLHTPRHAAPATSRPPAPPVQVHFVDCEADSVDAVQFTLESLSCASLAPGGQALLAGARRDGTVLVASCDGAVQSLSSHKFDFHVGAVALSSDCRWAAGRALGAGLVSLPACPARCCGVCGLTGRWQASPAAGRAPAVPAPAFWLFTHAGHLHLQGRGGVRPRAQGPGRRGVHLAA